ncbi:MAG: tail fiber domain-containing protein, partial [Actinobacteria bacterium]|nr:tail fiber domain-containing protein [Actinomycetota bacterium]
TLSGDASGSATFTNLGNATLSVSVNNDSHTHQFNNLTSKTSGTGDYKTDGNLVAGRGSGSIALTVNDSQGNANVTFNHENGVPDSTGSAARITSPVDSSGGQLTFEVADSATAGSTVSTTPILTLSTSGANLTTGSYSGNGGGLTNVSAVTASQWATARTITLSGAVTGSTSINGSSNVTISTTATSDPTLTLSGDATGSATFTNLGNATLNVSVSQATNASTLDSLNSTEFLRSNATDVASGRLTFSSASGLEVPYGPHGGYGDSNGSGTSWGAPIWSMGDAYNGSGSGTSYSVGNYNLSWLRGSHPSAEGVVGEGVYYYRAGNRFAAMGDAGTLFSTIVRATGDVVAFYSDERLKDFHGTIDSALDKVTALNGYYFTENEVAKSLGYDNKERQIGVSAQEVQKVFPEAIAIAPVSYQDGVDEEYLTVKYEKLVPALIEAIKEQQQQIDTLTEQVNKLLAASK